MKTYTAKRARDETKLMVVGEELEFSTFGHLSSFLRLGDLLVLNESGTLPASLKAKLERTGEVLEIRLAARGKDFSHWTAIAFGAGDWHVPTEKRGLPPVVNAEDTLFFGGQFSALVLKIDSRHNRLLEIKLSGGLEEIFRYGKPIQYSYHADFLALWDLQSFASALPLSVEPPSALFPLTGERLFELRKKFTVATLLHGAGLSSIGDSALDELLPLPEPYFVPEATMRAVREAKENGGRVIAFGTTVARALESAFEHGKNEGMATLKLGPSRPARVIDGLLTGFHDPFTSHFQLECGLASAARMKDAFDRAEEKGFRPHEFGDVVLVWKE